MNIADVHRWMDILGWTLLHSLWQGLIIMLLFLWIRRILPSATPAVKYAISTGALLLTLLAFAGTFICLVPDTFTDVLVRNERSTMEWTAFPSAGWGIDPSAGLQVLTRGVNDLLPVLFIGWRAGFLFFVFRLVVTCAHPIRLRIQAARIVRFGQSML